MTRKNTGFTLVEILIVVIILGILAAIVIPQFTEASNDARYSALVSDLQTVRGQLELYKVQHLTYPAAATFITQLTSRTNNAGVVGADPDAFPFGPYLQKFPTNPFASANGDIVEIGHAQAADGDPGWFFNSDTGMFYANTADHTSE